MAKPLDEVLVLTCSSGADSEGNICSRAVACDLLALASSCSGLRHTRNNHSLNPENDSIQQQEPETSAWHRHSQPPGAGGRQAVPVAVLDGGLGQAWTRSAAAFSMQNVPRFSGAILSPLSMAAHCSWQLPDVLHNVRQGF